MSLGVELIQAGAQQQAIVENLLQLYVHDFSELIPLVIGDDGRYSYPDLSLYWSDNSRSPFLARFEGKLAGFVLVTASDLSSDVKGYDMAEFFVLRSHRRRGIGSELAAKVWLHFPGLWQIRVMERNVGAFQFWASTIAGFTRRVADFRSFEIEGTRWCLFSFDSR